MNEPSNVSSTRAASSAYGPLAEYFVKFIQAYAA